MGPHPDPSSTTRPRPGCLVTQNLSGALFGEGVVALRGATADRFTEALVRAVSGTTTVFANATDEKGITISVELSPPADFHETFGRGMEAVTQKQLTTLTDPSGQRRPIFLRTAHDGFAGCRHTPD